MGKKFNPLAQPLFSVRVILSNLWMYRIFFKFYFSCVTDAMDRKELKILKV